MIRKELVALYRSPGVKGLVMELELLLVAMKEAKNLTAGDKV